MIEKNVGGNQNSLDSDSAIRIILESCSALLGFNSLIYKIEAAKAIPKGCRRMTRNDLDKHTAGV